MTDVNVEIIKDHGDGEVSLKVTVALTIWSEKSKIEDVKRDFEAAALKHAI